MQSNGSLNSSSAELGEGRRLARGRGRLKDPNGSRAVTNITELGNPLVRGSNFIGSLKLCLLTSVFGVPLRAMPPG